MARKLGSCTAVAAAPPADTTVVAATAAVPVTPTAAKCRLHFWSFPSGAVLLLLLLIQQQLAAALPFPNRKSSNTLITPDPSLGSVSAAETAATAAESAAEAAAAPFLSTISTDRGLHEHDQQQQQQQDQQHQQRLLPADASISLLSSAATTAATSGNRKYLCRNANSGGPCENRYDTMPDMKHLYCPANECCSKTKCVKGRCSAFCSSSWALCSSFLVRFEEYSYGNCSCKRFGSKCPPNSHCIDDNRPFMGPYCECIQGYVQDGDSCKEDLCKLTRCNPGSCTLKGLTPHCTCPSGYEVQDTGVHSRCQLKDMCTNSPCGDAAAVTSCSTTAANTYRCTCAAGYLVKVDPKTKKEQCVKAELKIKCSDSPCGSDGLENCTDTEEGYRCECKSGYKLVESSSGKSCQLVNPCDNNVCGPPYAVLSCSADANSYTCQCQEGFTLYTSTQNSAIKYCQPAVKEASTAAEKEEQDYSIYMMAGLGVAALGLVGVVGFMQRRRSAAPESDETEEQEEGLQEEHATPGAPVAGGEQQQHAITPSPGSWA